MATAEQSTTSGRMRVGLLLAGLAGLLVLAWAGGLFEVLSFNWLAENRTALAEFVSAQLGLAILLFLGLYIIAVALSLPGAVFLTLGGGFLFGGILGGALSVLAATAGASLLFVIAKSAAGEALAARAGPRLAKMRDGFAQNAFYYLLFLRLVPAFPFWLVNLAPAFLGVRWPVFAAATALGIIPGTFAFSFLGGGLDDIIAAQSESRAACLAQNAAAKGGTGAEACPFQLDVGQLLSWQLLAAFALLGVAALIPVLLQKRQMG